MSSPPERLDSHYINAPQDHLEYAIDLMSRVQALFELRDNPATNEDDLLRAVNESTDSGELDVLSLLVDIETLLAGEKIHSRYMPEAAGAPGARSLMKSDQ